MPLHLLPKKSWNVYSPANIARVKRDEALAAEVEAEVGRRKDEIDAAQRLLTLRGEGEEEGGGSSQRNRTSDVYIKESEAPATAAAVQVTTYLERNDLKRRAEHERKKRMRRRYGEDDTDRDIRVAREELGRSERKTMMTGGDDQLTDRVIRRSEDGSGKKEGSEVVDLFDASGHIALFPKPVNKHRNKSGKGNDRTSTRDSPRRKGSVTTISYCTKSKQKHNSNKDDTDNATGTRLMGTLTDRRSAIVAPWYNKCSDNAIFSNAVGGRSDATDRTNHRCGDSDNHLRRGLQENAIVADKTTASNDPLKLMRHAQSQIKRVEKQKQAVGRTKDYHCAQTRKDRRREERKGQRGREEG